MAAYMSSDPLVGITYAVGVYTEFRFKDQLPMDDSTWEAIFISGLVCAAAVRLRIRISPKVVLGTLLGACLALPFAIVLSEVAGQAAFIALPRLILIGAVIGVALAFKYSLW